MLSVEESTTNLQRHKLGFWIAGNQSDISYPENGNRDSLQLEDISFWFKHRNDCILASMRQYPPSGAILDIGGGNGFVSVGIKNAGMDVILLEPGIQGVLTAQARGLNPIINSSLHDAGFKPETIPAAGVFDVLEHIEDDVAFLQTVEQILKPGGRLYLTVPSYNFLYSDEDEYAGHYRRYSKRSLSKCVVEAGFEVEFASYLFFLLPLPIFLFRTLVSRFTATNKKDVPNPESDHTAPSNNIGALLNAIFAGEVWLLNKRIPSPFGGSCLLVARKKIDKL